jgi:hypothetical protein
MAHPLDGSRARIERAGDHLETLDSVLSRFVRDGGFRFASEHDPETDEYILRVYSNRQPPVPPPASAAVIVGDVLNNLRSALDYIIWQLAESPSRKNQFPICDTPELFKQKSKRYLFSVPSKHWAKIEAYQPYPGRDAQRALKMLAALNDADKHRLLLLAATGFSGLKTRFVVSGLDSIKITGRYWVPFEDGAELHRISVQGHSGSEMKVDATTPYSVLFRDPETEAAVTIADLRGLRLSISNVVESFGEDFED